LDNIRVGPEDVLGGEIGQGWTHAKFLLGNERVTNAQVPRSKRDLEILKKIALMERDSDGVPMLQKPDIRQRIAQIEIDLAGLEWSVLRELAQGHGEHSAPIASGLKIVGSEI